MNRNTLWIGALVASAFLAQAQADSIRLRSGERVRGKTTGYDEDSRVLSFETFDGTTLELPLEQLDHRSVYGVKRDQVARDSAVGQLQLGHFARDVELFAHARRHYDRALGLDAQLKPRVEEGLAVLSTRAAEASMKRAQVAIKRGDLHVAEKWLIRIVREFPDEPVAAKAAPLLDQVYADVHGQRDALLRERDQELLRGDLKRGKEYYDRMLDKNKLGLMETRSGSRAVRLWESALRDGTRALREIHRLEAKYEDELHTSTLEGYRQLANELIIEVRLNLASHYMQRQSYSKALTEVNQSLAIDAGNQQALAMRTRIENASGQGILWWPGIGFDVPMR